MREYIHENIIEIKKHFKKRSKKISKSNNKSIVEEFREWANSSIDKEDLVWTLPDLTNIERNKNFCRSIKKKIK